MIDHSASGSSSRLLRSSTWERALLLAALVCLLAVQGCSRTASDNGVGSAKASESTPHRGYPYPTNSHGDTYGSAADAPSPELEPDLISVQSDDGVKGYVWKADLDEASGALATTSAEIEAVLARREAIRLPVFRSAVTSALGDALDLSQAQWRELIELADLTQGTGVVSDSFGPAEALSEACALLRSSITSSGISCERVSDVLSRGLEDAREATSSRIVIYDSDGTTPLGWFTGAGG